MASLGAVRPPSDSFAENMSFSLGEAPCDPVRATGGAAPRGPAPRVFLAGLGDGPSRRPTGTETTKMANPFEFIQQVRSEAYKVIWPGRRETLVTTGLVLLLVVFTSVFFVIVDQVLREFVALALGFGRGG